MGLRVGAGSGVGGPAAPTCPPHLSPNTTIRAFASLREPMPTLFFHPLNRPRAPTVFLQLVLIPPPALHRYIAELRGIPTNKKEGKLVRILVGVSVTVGDFVGDAVFVSVRNSVGESVAVGMPLRLIETVGLDVGDKVGDSVVLLVSVALGVSIKVDDGLAVGLCVGVAVAVSAGLRVGDSDGVNVCVSEGVRVTKIDTGVNILGSLDLWQTDPGKNIKETNEFPDA